MVRIKQVHDIVNSIVEVLNTTNAGFVSISTDDVTIIVTTDKTGADHMKNAWDRYIDDERENDAQEH